MVAIAAIAMEAANEYTRVCMLLVKTPAKTLATTPTARLRLRRALDCFWPSKSMGNSMAALMDSARDSIKYVLFFGCVTGYVRTGCVLCERAVRSTNCYCVSQ